MDTKNSQSTTGTTLPRLIPLTEWPSHHAWPPLGGLRHLVFNAATNGFAPCIRKVGKRILISEVDFFEWIESQNAKAAR